MASPDVALNLVTSAESRGDLSASASANIKRWLTEPPFLAYRDRLVEDVKAGFELGVGHHASFKRLAMVSDLEWIRNSIRLLGWMSPGELKLFDLDQLPEAIAWAAG